MKYFAVLLFLVLESAAAFSLLPYKTTPTRTPSLLKYTIIAPPDEADEQSEDRKDDTVVAKQATADQGGPGSLEGYHDYDEIKEQEDLLNVDSFDNEAGGIIPGFHLSSLCSDDWVSYEERKGWLGIAHSVGA